MLRALAAKFLLRCLALIPLRVLHGAGALLGRLLWIFPTRVQRVTRLNLALCFPELSAPQQKRLARAVLVETGKSLFEIAPVWFAPQEKVLRLVSQVSGLEEFLLAVRTSQGGIMAVPHLGCWEIIGQYVSTLHPMTALYRPPRLQALDRLSVDVRSRFGAQMARTDASGVRALYRALEQGRIVAILPDQDPSGGNGVFAPFFGVPAYTMTLLSRLARKYQVPVFYTYAQRLPAGRGFHLQFVRASAEVAHADAQTAVSALNSGVESCVRKGPEQYQWGYKRFKTRAPGEASIY